VVRHPGGQGHAVQFPLPVAGLVTRPCGPTGSPSAGAGSSPSA
jgi:hypothetical protein